MVVGCAKMFTQSSIAMEVLFICNGHPLLDCFVQNYTFIENTIHGQLVIEGASLVNFFK